MSAATNWTGQQLEAIRHRGSAALASAAAGSGKTATLAARCASLVLELPSSHALASGDGRPDCSVEELLVVTFTEDAAAEMGDRIRTTIMRVAKEHPSEHNQRQALLAPAAEVSTIHGFCTRVLRQHGLLVGLQPDFRVADEAECGPLRARAFETVVQAAYRGPEAAALRDFLEGYCDTQLPRLEETVRKIAAIHAVVVNPAEWDRRAVAALDALTGPHCMKTVAMARELSLLAGELMDMAGPIGAVAEKAANDTTGKLGKIGEYAARWAEGLSACAKALKEGDMPRVQAAAGGLPTGARPYVRGKADPEHKAVSDELAALFPPGGGPKEVPATLRSIEPAAIRRDAALVLPHAKLLISLTAAFEAEYGRLKRAAGVVDFNDMERFTLLALQHVDAATGQLPVAVALRHRYRHVLVDEFQDVNGVQAAILSAICNPDSRGEGARAFSVGDVKQSIYRFRLADPGEFLRLEERYAEGVGGRVLPMSSNFRSRREILDVVNGVFSALMVGGRTDIDYVKGHQLSAGAVFPPGPAEESARAVQLHVLAHPSDIAKAAGTAVVATPEDGEMSGAEGDTDDADDQSAQEREFLLAAQIVRQRVGSMLIVDRTSGEQRPLRYGDCAILLRAVSNHAGPLGNILRGAGVPFINRKAPPLLEQMEVRDVLCLLRLACGEHEEILWAALLRSPLAVLIAGRASGGEASERRDIDALLLQLAPEQDGPGLGVVLTELREGRDSPRLTEAQRGFLGCAVKYVDELSEVARAKDAADLLRQVYHDTGYERMVLATLDGPQRRANLWELLRLAEAARASVGGGAGGGGGADVARFVENLLSSKPGPAMPQLDVDGGADSAGGGRGAVSVMTVHASKGLEFPLVVVLRLGQKWNMKDAGVDVLCTREEGLALRAYDPAIPGKYAWPHWTIVGQAMKSRAVAEELRLLYVAMTRAREQLHLIGTAKAPKEKEEAGADEPMGTLNDEDVLEHPTALAWFETLVSGPDEGGLSPLMRVWREVPERPIELSRGFYQAVVVRPEVLEGRPLVPAEIDAAQLDSAMAALSASQVPYAMAWATSAPAAVSVTRLAKGDGELPMSADPAAAADRVTAPAALGEAPPIELSAREPAAGHGIPRGWAVPKLLADVAGSGGSGGRLTAVDRGTATHLVLEHVDFARPATDGQIVALADDLRRRGLLTTAEVSSLDVTGIRWVTEGECGALLRSGTVLRELPVYFPAEGEELERLMSRLGATVPPGGNPSGRDRPMVRGRVDVVMDTPAGLVVLDYKTDGIGPDLLPARTEFYRPQLTLYAGALSRLTGRPVVGCWLAFLTPRTLVKL